MTPAVNCIYANMPTAIRAYTINNSDTTYTIVLNARLTREQHLLAYHHEMNHIEHGDYDKKVDIDMLEFYAHE